MSNRIDLLKVLRETTAGDLWLTTYAMFQACEELDLANLISVVDRVLDGAEGRDKVPASLRALLQERWGVTSQ